MTLALYGGTPAVSPLERFNTIGCVEALAADLAIKMGPLSGFLGGVPHGGPWVQRLEELWAAKFGVQYAIACNSATSGLLVACAAVGVGNGDEVLTTPFTMSATSAAPAFLGAKLIYGDVDKDTMCLTPTLDLITAKTKAVVITNLFGHPASLAWWRRAADAHGFYLIEDNAQAIMAQENGVYAGAIGHIGVWSLNVHKHLQCGEGGICTTNDKVLADRMRKLINHAEMFP